MNRISFVAALIAVATPFAAQAQQKLGDHPAVVTQRLQAHAGYDYESKFYPHPAWLYLSAEAPRSLSDPPAVLDARRVQPESEPMAQAGRPQVAQRSDR